MKSDGMLTTHKMIVRAEKRLAEKSAPILLHELATLEPVLAEYIDHSLTVTVGKLALAGAPSELVQGVHEDCLKAVLTAIAALRRGHYKLWRDTAFGERLAKLDPLLEPTRSVPYPDPIQPDCHQTESGAEKPSG